MFSRIILLTTLLTSASALILRSTFNEWIDKFNIEVHNDEHRDILFSNWNFNDKYIEYTNSKNLTYSLGHNQFSGMDKREFSEYLKYSSGDFKIKPITQC